jgi:chromatin remodeling complex protein RSC6
MDRLSFLAGSLFLTVSISLCLGVWVCRRKEKRKKMEEGEGLRETGERRDEREMEKRKERKERREGHAGEGKREKKKEKKEKREEVGHLSPCRWLGEDEVIFS